jgi:hypothetical protein
LSFAELCDVGKNFRRLHIALAQFGYRAACTFIDPIDDDDLSTFFSQAFGRCSSDSLSCPCDNADLLRSPLALAAHGSNSPDIIQISCLRKATGGKCCARRRGDCCPVYPSLISCVKQHLSI